MLNIKKIKLSSYFYKDKIIEWLSFPIFIYLVNHLRHNSQNDEQITVFKWPSAKMNCLINSLIQKKSPSKLLENKASLYQTYISLHWLIWI